MKRYLAVFAVLLIAVTASATASAEVIDRVVAVVSGQIITKSDLDAANAFGLAGSLDELIDRTLMLSEVRRVAPPEPAASAIDTRVARIRERFDTPAAFAHALATSGIDESVLRIYAADDLRLTAYMNERFSVASQPTEEEVRNAGEPARARLTADRRQALVTAWAQEIRRRADITILQ